MKYKSQGKQLTFEAFRSSLDNLPKSNRWVRMGDELPWDEIERYYNSRLNNRYMGAGNKPARMVVGALIVKHKMNLSDEETILAIQENPYMQYMLGLSEYTEAPVFDPSLFVTIRKRLQISDLNSFTDALLKLSIRREDSARNDKEDSGDNREDSGDSDTFIDSSGTLHKGSMKIDATCCDAEVRYPTDVDLLEDGSRVINRYIAKLCRKFHLPLPPTFGEQARKVYLGLVKLKKKSRSRVKKCKGLMLNYLMRDIRSFVRLVAVNGTQLLDALRRDEKRTLKAIVTLYHQQEFMYRNDTNRVTDRIVSIFQPHVRPIVRGKSKAPTEFGAKIGASVVKGYTFIDHHSWDAYNEESDLELQIDLYRERLGYFPARVYADKIYMNRNNRLLMKELEIKAMGKPLGRPPKEGISKAELQKAVGERNEVEGTFGTGKRIYRANNIRAKLPETAACWTGMCYFVKNVMKFLRELLRALILMAYGMRNPKRSGELQENRTGILDYRIAGTYLFSRPYLIPLFILLIAFSGSLINQSIVNKAAG